MTKQLFDLCIVIPAYNEALVIQDSIKAMAPIIPLEHVYVVSDGSTDATASLAKGYTSNVLELKRNVGKAEALDALIEVFSLKKKYKYILFSDADSRLSHNFLTEIRKFVADEPACIVGAVVSDRKGLVSAFRTYEYWLSNTIFKQAQNLMGVITVAPGCASLYRSSVLDKLEFSRRTLTEDFDLTLQIYTKKLGAIVFASRAQVITQDPLTLRDYWKQVMRWYTGFWQNIFLHKMWLPTRRVSWEILLLLFDSLIWFVILFAALSHPKHLLDLLLYTYLLVTGVGFVTLLLQRAWWALPYVPLFPVFQLMNLSAYLLSLARSIFFGHQELGWHKLDRYATSTHKKK